MKRIILLAIIGLFMGLNANAQVANREMLNYSFGGVFRNSDGEKLSKQELQNYLSSYEYADYLSASRKFKNGVILTGVGVGCIGGTLLWLNAFTSDEVTEENVENKLAGAFYGGMASIVALAGGVICTAIGVPKMLIANNKLKGVADDYNNHPSASISIGMQQYGYGIALIF